MSKVFLLSPADMRGLRARQLISPTSRRTISVCTPGMSIETVFTYTSSLYFRGKMAYARRFVVPPVSCRDEGIDEGIYVIAPGFGLVSPDWNIDLSRMRRLRRVPVDPTCRAFRESLNADARALATRLPSDTTVVLLGSLMQRKYLGFLWPIFRERLRVPQAFVGTGDMRRGALMLRAALSGQELPYIGCADLMGSDQ